MSEIGQNTSTKRGSIFLIVGIFLIAINLRPALAGVGPLIEDIRKNTGLSNGMLGLLTTLPLIAFSAISVFTPFFTKRFGIGRTLSGALLLLTFGISIRYIPSNFTLYFGTLLAGIAIAFGNVLLPSLTKQNFAEKSGFVTSLYSSGIAIGATLAAGISVPLAHSYGLNWRGSLAVWAVLSLFTFFVWLPQSSRLKKTTSKRDYFESMKTLSQSKTAWQIALFMGFQSLTFYVILAWLPAILQSRGYDAAYSGWMLSLSQATGIIGSLVFPTLAGNRKDQRGIVLFLVVAELIALIGLFLPDFGNIFIWIGLLGLTLGGTFGLSLLFIILRSKDAESATELSGMAQSIGYFVAATGPIIFGSIYDLTGNWTYPFILLFVLCFLKLVVGMGAGKAVQSE